MFEVLVFVYENYWRGDACPELHQLERKLSAHGFEPDEIHDALVWLDGLNVAAETITVPAEAEAAPVWDAAPSSNRTPAAAGSGTTAATPTPSYHVRDPLPRPNGESSTKIGSAPGDSSFTRPRYALYRFTVSPARTLSTAEQAAPLACEAASQEPAPTAVSRLR